MARSTNKPVPQPVVDLGLVLQASLAAPPRPSTVKRHNKYQAAKAKRQQPVAYSYGTGGTVRAIWDAAAV